MKPIPPRPDLPPTQLDSEDLIRLAHLMSRRLQLECPRCHTTLKPSVAGREFRLGSSPDLSALDPQQTGKPRLVFFCYHCKRPIGHLQGDHWLAQHMDTDAESTRWDHLEMGDDNA